MTGTSPQPPRGPDRRTAFATALPWGVAVLAVLVAAWLGTQAFIASSERTLAAQREALLLVSLKAAQTQLEAEQLVGARLAANERPAELSAGTPSLVLLQPSRGGATPAGAIAMAGGRGALRVSGLPTDGARLFELWTSGSTPTKLAAFTADADGNAQAVFAVVPGSAGFVVRAAGTDAPLLHER